MFNSILVLIFYIIRRYLIISSNNSLDQDSIDGTWRDDGRNNGVGWGETLGEG